MEAQEAGRQFLWPSESGSSCAELALETGSTEGFLPGRPPYSNMAGRTGDPGQEPDTQAPSADEGPRHQAGRD